MPELPEVETVVSDLNKKVVGKKIVGIWSDWTKMLKNISFEELKNKVVGKKIHKVARRGKNILIEIEGEKTISIHLKMTGHLLWRLQKYFQLLPAEVVKEDQKKPFKEKVNQYVHFRFLFERGRELAFSDLRKFGRIKFYDKNIIETLKDPEYAKLGLEPTENEFNFFSLKELTKKSKNANKEVKIFLLNQENISGIGNIYASEILFEAGINPQKKVSSLTEKELKKIIEKTKKILKEAIANRGTSISDFRDTAGLRGGFGQLRKVYQRKGEKCPRCEDKIISRKQGQRTTFYCPKCQR